MTQNPNAKAGQSSSLATVPDYEGDDPGTVVIGDLLRVPLVTDTPVERPLGCGSDDPPAPLGGTQ